MDNACPGGPIRLGCVCHNERGLLCLKIPCLMLGVESIEECLAPGELCYLLLSLGDTCLSDLLSYQPDISVLKPALFLSGELTQCLGLALMGVVELSKTIELELRF